MLPQNFVVKNVDLWNPAGVQSAQDVFVADGKIQAIVATGAKNFHAETEFDGKGHALLPVGLDLQVHLRVPGQSEKEVPLTGLKAALRGGFGAILTMPNTKPIMDTPSVCEQAKKAVADAERQTGVKVLYSAALTMGQEGVTPVDVAALKKWGVAALTDDGVGVARDEVMRQCFEAAAKAGLPVLQHAEVPGHGGVLAPGPTQQKLGLKAYAPEAEWKMVERDINLVRQIPNARYHVLHVSSRKTLDLIRAAKKEGLKVTGEVSPHHLFFTSEDIPEGNTAFKMNPPLRSNEDREALRVALQDGTLEFMATDHAPHELARKGQDFSASAFGTTGLETALRVLLYLRELKALSTERLVQVFSTAPARYMGLEAEYGELKVGKPFRATWLDAKAKAAPLKVAELESLSKNNCFLDAPLPGKILGVFNEAGFFRFSV